MQSQLCNWERKRSLSSDPYSRTLAEAAGHRQCRSSSCDIARGRHATMKLRHQVNMRELFDNCVAKQSKDEDRLLVKVKFPEQSDATLGSGKLPLFLLQGLDPSLRWGWTLESWLGCQTDKITRHLEIHESLFSEDCVLIPASKPCKTTADNLPPSHRPSHIQ